MRTHAPRLAHTLDRHTIMDTMTIDADGMYCSSFTLKPKDGAPLRVEAELLREDADSVGCADFQVRTHG
jgi:hypothetical protein